MSKKLSLINVLAFLFFAGGVSTVVSNIFSLGSLNALANAMPAGTISMKVARASMLGTLCFLGPVQIAAGIGLLRKTEWGYMLALIACGALFSERGSWMLSQLLQLRVSAQMIVPALVLVQALLTVLVVWDRIQVRTDISDQDPEDEMQ